MACRYTYKGKTYEAWEFEDVLTAMSPAEASAFMPSVNSIPDAPFVTNTDKWLNLALKRVITMAVEGGYEKVAFVNGQQSVDRYWGNQVVADAVARWNEVTKPQSIGELADDVLGRKMSALVPLDHVDAGVLPMLKNDQVLKAVVSRIAVDVVDMLSGYSITPEQLVRDGDMVFDRLSVNDRGRAATALGAAIGETSASIRAKLGSLRSGGGDFEILPALSASDIDPRLVAGLLDPVRLFHGNTRGGPHGAAPTRATAESSSGSDGRLLAVKQSATELAGLLNSHAEIIHGREGLLKHGFEAPPSEGMKAFYDQIVPNAVKALAKKLGGEVGTVTIEHDRDNFTDYSIGGDEGAYVARFGGESKSFERWSDASQWVKDHFKLTQSGLTITPAMREKVESGLPLFSKRDATWNDDRIDRLMSKYAYTMDDNRTRAYAAWVRPQDFLDATTPSDFKSKLESEKSPLDKDQLMREVQEIQLISRDHPKSGGVFKTEGHEGRHRMMALRDAGVERVPVTLTIPTKNGAEPLTSVFVSAQKWSGGPSAQSGFTIERMIPISWAHHDELKAEFGGEGDVSFSAKDQTETPEFKRWFGDSKVVDSKGKPLVVYHGTKADFTVFDISKFGGTDAGWFGKGFYFADDKKVAKRYGKVMPVYLRIERPMSSNETAFDAETIRKIIARTKALDHGFSPEKWLAEDIASEKKALDQLDRLYRAGAAIDVVLRALTDVVGFDGVVSNGIYIAFRPEQIKSATGNNGQFDSTNPDITRSARDDDYPLRQSSREIVGDVGRTYTADQKAAFARVGFEVEKPSLKERAQALWKDAGKKLAQGLFDQFAPVRELSQDAYGLLRLAKGSAGSFETLLKGGKLKLTDGVYDFDETQKGGVIDRLLIPMQGEHHDFLRWVAANRAEGLLAEGRENLFTQDDIDAIKTLQDGRLGFDYTLQHGPRAGSTTRVRAEMYADSLKTFNEFNKNVLDMASQSGLIDEESRHLWEGEFYVPFYRVSEEDGLQGANIKGGVVRQKAFQKLKGGKDVLNADLLDNTLMNWAHLLDASAKNRAAKATLEAAEAAGAAIPASEDIARQIGKATGNRHGVVWFMDQGLQRFYLVEDPYLMSAIASLEYAGMKNPVMNAMSAVKHYLTVGVTASPFFKVRNLIRDSVQAVAVAELSYNPAKNLAEGWAASDQKGDMYFRLLAGGGTIHFGTMLEGSEAKRVQALVEAGVNPDNILDNSHKLAAFYKRRIKPAIDAYNELGNRGETINRAALYKQLIAQGKSHAEASLMARDLMDFSMQGNFATIRFLTQVVPFLNARLQGLNKLGKAARENPQRMALVMGAVAMMSLALLALYGDDDDWKKREDWDRDNFWWFKIGGVAYRVPKPFEIGAFGTLAERSAELVFSDEMTGDRFRSRVMALLGDNLSMNPVPQLVKPMLDVYANKDSFSGRPIETMGMDRLRAPYRFTANTSMTARAASTAMNAVTGLVGKESLSPVQVDSLIRGYFGWLGMFIVGGADIVARAATDQPTRPTPDLWKVATGGMISELAGAQSRYVSQVYDQARTIEQAYGTWRSLQKEGKTEQAADFKDANIGKIQAYRNVEAIKGAISKINQRIRDVEASDMSREEKRDEVRRLNRRKDEFSRRLTPA